MPPDLATARALVESERLGVPTEYHREILRVAIAIFDHLGGQAKAEPVATAAPTRKR